MRQLLTLLSFSMLLLVHALPLRATESVWDGKTIATSFYSGTGTKSNPYTIYTASQFAYFYIEMTKGRTFEEQYISLKNDIDMTKTPLKKMDGVGSNNVKFYGHFNGEDHSLATYEGGYTSSTFGNIYGSVHNVVFAKYYNSRIATVESGGELYNCKFEISADGAVSVSDGGKIINCYCYYSDRWQNPSKYGGALGFCTGNGTCLNCQFVGMTYISYGGYTASNYSNDYTNNEFNEVSDEEHNQWVAEHNTSDRTYKTWPMTFSPTYPSFTVDVSFVDESGFTNYYSISRTAGTEYTLPVPSGFESEFLGWEVNGEIVSSFIPTDKTVCKAVWKHSFVQQPSFINPTAIPQDKSKATTQWYYMAEKQKTLSDDINTIEVKYDNSVLEFDYSATSSSGGYSSSGYSGYISVDGTTIASCHDGDNIEGHYQIVLSKGQHTISRSAASTTNVILSSPSTPIGSPDTYLLDLNNIICDNGVYYCEVTYGNEKICTDILDTSVLFYGNEMIYYPNAINAILLKVPADATSCLIPLKVVKDEEEYTVTEISDYAFAECSNLKDLTCLSENVPLISVDAFKNTKCSEGTLHVPYPAIEAYKKADGWKEWGTFAGVGPDPDTDITDIANTVYLDNCEVFSGKNIELLVKMKNDISVTGFQFDIVLPEGITVAQSEEGLYDITLSTERTTAAKTNTFDSSLMSDGSVRVLAASTHNDVFSGNDGEVCRIKLKVSEDLPAGDYPVILKNIELTNAAGQTWNVSRLKRTITVKAPIPVTGVSLGKSTLSLAVGESETISPIIAPADATNKELIWSSANNNVATVKDGTVTAIAPGSTQINVVTADGSNITASCTVIVTQSSRDDNPNDYATVLYATDAEGCADGTFALPIELKSEFAVKAFQFDVELPEGMNFVADNNAYACYPTNRINGGYSVICNSKTGESDKVAQILCSNSSNPSAAISGTSGIVLNIPIVIASDVQEGEYEIFVKNITLVKADGAEYKDLKAKLFKAKISVVSYVLGDANNSGEVNVADITTVVSHIYGQTPEKFNFAAADVNASGEINVADITGIVSIIYGGSASGAKGASKAQAEDVTMSLPTVTANASAEVCVPIYIDNADAISAYQFDLALPENVQVKDVRSISDAHQCMGAYMENSKYRVMSYSMTNDRFVNASAPVGYITLVVDDDAQEGTYDVNLSSVAASANGKECNTHVASGKLVVSNPTGINNIDNDTSKTCDVTTLGGVKMASGTKLSKGVYIVNGKKQVVR